MTSYNSSAKFVDIRNRIASLDDEFWVAASVKDQEAMKRIAELSAHMRNILKNLQAAEKRRSRLRRVKNLVILKKIRTFLILRGLGDKYLVALITEAAERSGRK